MVLRHGAVSAFTVDPFMNEPRTNKFQMQWTKSVGSEILVHIGNMWNK